MCCRFIRRSPFSSPACSNATTLVQARWLMRGTVGWFLFPAVIAIAVPVIFVVVGQRPRHCRLAVRGGGGDLRPVRLVALRGRGPEAALLRGVVASIFVAITVYGVTLPLLPALFPSALIAEEVRRRRCTEPQVASTGSYQEPSLVFLLGTDTRFTDGAGAAEFLNHGACRFALDRCAQRAQFRAARRCARPALRAAARGSTATTSASAARSRCRCFVRSRRHDAAGGASHRAACSGRCGAAPTISRPRSRYWCGRCAGTARTLAARPGNSSASAPARRLSIFLFVMILIDAAMIRAVAHLPRWIIWFFDADHRLRQVRLVPLAARAFCSLRSAALPAMLPRMPQRVLAAIMVRVGFLFVAIGAAQPVRHHHQAHDRTRPPAGDRQRSILTPSVRSSGAPTMPACRRATPPPPLPRWSRSARCGRARARSCGFMRC